MNMGNWSFQPRLIPGLITLIAILVLTALGLWQLDRADQKQSLFDQFQQRGKMAVVELNGPVTGGLENLFWRRASITGDYHKRWQILLDNQVNRGKVGYQVFTPMNISGPGEWILIDRGWIPAGLYRSTLPEIDNPPGQITVTGRIQEPPFSGILLNNEFIENLNNNVLRTQSIRLDKLEEITGLKLLPFIVKLDPASATGFLRNTQTPGFGKARHLGYAFQWFALAVVVAFIYFYLNIRRLPE